MDDLKNLNVNLAGLIKAIRERDLDVVFHKLSAFSSEFKYIKKRNVVKITLELPADQVSTNEGSVSDILKSDLTKNSKLPLIPIIAVLGNKIKATQGE